MIELYQTEKSAAGARIAEALRELVLAHKVITVTPDMLLPEELPAGTTLPALRDQGQVIAGAEAIQAHLRQLEHIATEWRKYQSDACYVESDDGIC
jgi:hypothetical protein